MSNYTRLICGACTLLALACMSDQAPTDGDQGDSEEGGGHGDSVTAITHWTEQTELFVEFPALVVGQESAFAAHLTRVSDFTPVDAGPVTVLLTGGGSPDETFTVKDPSIPGIFRPVAIPRYAGSRVLSLRLSSPGLTVTHELGKVTVFADADSAARAAPEEDPDNGAVITFLKEQQWPIGFTMAQATKRSLRPSMAASGTLRGRADGEAMVTAPVAGRLVTSGKVFPVLGQLVERNQILVNIARLPGGNAGIASLQLAASRAELSLGHSQKELKRLEALGADGAVSKRRVAEARLREAESQAELTAAKSRLGQHGRVQRVSSTGRGSGMAVRAPTRGTLVAVNVAPGEFVEAGAAMFQIIDTERLWLEVKVPEANIGKLIEPAGAWFDIAGFDQHFNVPSEDLVSNGAIVDPRDRTISLIFNIDNPSRRLRAGMFASVHLMIGPPVEVVSIPFAAVLDDGGQQVVFVQLGGEAFLRKPVRLGIRDGDNVEVLQGVQAGEYVAVEGAFMVKLAASSTAAPAHGHGH